jgi:hypothetical protein
MFTFTKPIICSCNYSHICSCTYNKKVMTMIIKMTTIKWHIYQHDYIWISQIVLSINATFWCCEHEINLVNINKKMICCYVVVVLNISKLLLFNLGKIHIIHFGWSYIMTHDTILKFATWHNNLSIS